MKYTGQACYTSRMLRALSIGCALTISAVACPEPASEPVPDVTLSDVDAGPPDGAGDSSADLSPDVALPPLDLITVPAAGQARAGIVTSPDELLAGPKADGQVGDAKIFNSKVAFIIEGVRPASGYRVWGGNVADVAAVNADGSLTPDTFGEIGHTWNLMIFEPQSIEVVDDGRGGSDAHIRVHGVVAPMAWAEDLLGALTVADELFAEITYDYFLPPDAEALRHEVRFTNVGMDTARVDVPLLLSSQGDGMNHWQPGSGFGDDVGTASYIAMSGRDLAHALYAVDSNLSPLVQQTGVFVVTENEFAVAPGETFTRSYYRAVSRNGISGVEQIGASLGVVSDRPARIDGVVTLPETVAPQSAWVAVWSADDPQTMAPVSADGAFSVHVPDGDYRIQVHALGHAPSTFIDVTASAAAPVNVDVTIEAAALLTVNVADSSGAPVDARVMAVVPSGDTTTPSPHAAEGVDVRGADQWRWEGGFGRVSAVGYAVGGTTTLVLPAGDYEVRGTRGFFYSVDSDTVTVTTDGIASLDLTIDNRVDSTGWVSADFHIHALRSPDSQVPHSIRVLQALTEGIDAPVMTEHVALHSMAPNIVTLGLQGAVLDVPGQEVSTVTFGHFNAFPLEWLPNQANGGGVVEHGRSATELFDGIASQSALYEPFVQVNHPRGSSAIQSYFEYLGLDPVTAEPTKNTSNWDTRFDGVEVFNASCDVEESFQDWVNLTNAGLRKALSSGSDTHGENDPIGKPRQLVQVDHSAVEANPQAIADAMKARRSVVSCGPMVTFGTDDGVYGLGDLAPVAGDGSVSLRVQVQAPAWQELVEVRVLKNGALFDVIPITETAPGVRLDTTVSDSPLEDAWYMVQVVGSGSLLPVHTGGPPAAFTNPIEVDADGDGVWTPPGVN